MRGQRAEGHPGKRTLTRAVDAASRWQEEAIEEDSRSEADQLRLPLVKSKYSGIEKDPGSLAFARDDTKKGRQKKERPRVILSRCGEESRRTLQCPAPCAGKNALAREILRCAQDDTKKVLTGRSPHLLPH
jgi:hypothetical protein